MICQWERYKATRAPMPSQQQQVFLCQCTACRNATLLFDATISKAAGIKPATAERLAVLQWKPEPPRGPETAA